MKQLPSLAVFLAIVCLVAISGIVFEPGAWYTALNKSAWTPPNIAFPIAWTLLYLLVALAGWLAWYAPGRRLPAFGIYALQLVLNAAWSWLFFGLQRPGYALLDAVIMLIVIGINMLIFWRRRSLAGLLLVPYFAWVGFAVYLNAAVFWLN